MIKIVLPFTTIPQPSWTKGKKRGYHSYKYNVHKTKIESFLRTRIKPIPSNFYPIKIEVKLYQRKPNKKSDLDNHLKFLLDRLQGGGVLCQDNMNHIRKVSIELVVDDSIIDETIIDISRY